MDALMDESILAAQKTYRHMSSTVNKRPISKLSSREALKLEERTK